MGETHTRAPSFSTNYVRFAHPRPRGTLSTRLTVRAGSEFVISDVDALPDFVSIARGWSFYGTIASADEDQTFFAAQALSDPDIINRYFAFRCETLRIS